MKNSLVVLFLLVSAHIFAQQTLTEKFQKIGTVQQAQQFIDANPELKPLQANSPESLTKYIRWVSTAVLKSASSPASLGGDSGPPDLNIPIPAMPDGASADDVW